MDMLLQLSPLLLMFVIFYFLLIRPQQKRQRKVQQMQADLKKGDKVITIGGMHATVNALDENTIVVLVDNGTKLTYERSAVREVVNAD